VGVPLVVVMVPLPSVGLWLFGEVFPFLLDKINT
jgi:hypothetical protein